MDKDGSNNNSIPGDKSKGTEEEAFKMATQIAPTPVLYGKDAEAVFKELQEPPSQNKIEEAKKRSKFFKKIRKKGLD
ncbi:MAG: hypothetical protein ACM3MK_00820 [Chitinophagales bacterium]